MPLAASACRATSSLRDRSTATVFVDPFHGGRLLDAQGCQRLFHRLTGAGDAVDEPTTSTRSANLSIVTRMLNNLRVTYGQRHDDAGSAGCCAAAVPRPTATTPARGRAMAP